MTPDSGAPQDEPIVVQVDPDIQDLVPAFLLNRKKDIERIESALSGNDFEAIRTIGHSIRGAGGGYGFPDISILGEDLERAAKDGSAQRVRYAMDRLSGYLNRVQVVAGSVGHKKGPPKPLILSVDDDADTLKLMQRLLDQEDFDVVTAPSATRALEILRNVQPDLILLDILMPLIDGYTLCGHMLKKEKLAFVPIVFVTSLGDEQNKARAFAAGAVDYLVKPVQRESLRRMVLAHLKTRQHWEALRKGSAPAKGRARRLDLDQFKKLLLDQLELDAEKRRACLDSAAGKLYATFARAGVAPRVLARKIAAFMDVPFCPTVAPEDIQLGVLPTPFCRSNYVVPIRDMTRGNAFVLSNPFDWQVMDVLKSFRNYRLLIADPHTIFAFLAEGSGTP